MAQKKFKVFSSKTEEYIYDEFSENISVCDVKSETKYSISNIAYSDPCKLRIIADLDL